MKHLYFLLLLSCSFLQSISQNNSEHASAIQIYESSFSRNRILKEPQTLSGLGKSFIIDYRKKKITSNKIEYHLKRVKYFTYLVDSALLYHAVMEGGKLLESEGKTYRIKGMQLLDKDGNMVAVAQVAFKKWKGKLSIWVSQDVPDLVLALFYYKLIKRYNRNDTYDYFQDQLIFGTSC